MNRSLGVGMATVTVLMLTLSVTPAFSDTDGAAPGVGVQAAQQDAYERATAALLALESTDMVLTVRDGVYDVRATRGTVRFVREPDGAGWRYRELEVTGANPVGNQSPRALATLEEELAAAGVTDPAEITIGPEETSYPAAYERIAALFDDPRAPDLVYVPRPDGDATPGHIGAHGSLDVTQSRAPLVLSGPGVGKGVVADTHAMAVDIAPTIAHLLDLDRTTGFTLNGSPAEGLYLRRQDGRVLREILEPRPRVYTVVVDGLRAEDVTPDLMPNLTGLIEGGPATVYEQARGVLPSETSVNFFAMASGAYSGTSGMVGNEMLDRDTDRVLPAYDFAPEAETFFEAVERQRPGLVTAGIFGAEATRRLFTGDGDPDVDVLWGAGDAAPEDRVPGVGHAQDRVVVDTVIRTIDDHDPDFTLTQLKLVDLVQHGSGPGTPTAHDAIREADRQIVRLVDHLQATGRWDRSVLMVTADHGFTFVPFPTNDELAVPDSPEGTWNRIRLAQILDGAGFDGFRVIADGGGASVYLDGFENTPDQQATLLAMRDTILRRSGIHNALLRLPAGGGGQETLDGRHPAWRVSHERIGELFVTAEPGYALVDPDAIPLRGYHGGPFQRHVPFVVLGGASLVTDATVGPSAPHLVDQADDTDLLPEQPETVDVVPTAAALLGIDPPANAEGRVLAEALTPQARAGDAVPPDRPQRVVMFLSDGMHMPALEWALRHQGDEGVPALPNIATLVSEGTMLRYGSMVGFPSVTMPNHNTVGSGAWLGHHGLVGNRWYERGDRQTVDALDFFPPLGPFFTSQLLRDDVETLYEAVNRTHTPWSPTAPDGVFTASVNEPSARGASYATLEVRIPGLTEFELIEPASLGSRVAPYFVPGLEDTHTELASQDAGYATSTHNDNLSQAQAQFLLDASAHPVPTFMFVNFSLTDSAGHWAGPHGAPTRAAFEETDRRIGRILDRARQLGLYDDTLWVLTADHGMSAGDPERSRGWREALEAAGLRFVDLQPFLYLPAMDVAASTTDFEAATPVTVTFTVTDHYPAPDGSPRPVPGATVTITNGDGSMQEEATNEAGEASFTFTPTGTEIRLRVDHPDFNPAERLFERTEVPVEAHPGRTNALRKLGDNVAKGVAASLKGLMNAIDRVGD